MISELEKRHNNFAPYWAAGMVILTVTGLATIWIDLGDFWKGYVLDMTGPSWNYILVRMLFTTYKYNSWRRFFTPFTTLIIFLAVCAGIEGAQYLELYESTFDKWDLLAYASILVPLFLLDSLQQSYKIELPGVHKVENEKRLNRKS